MKWFQKITRKQPNDREPIVRTSPPNTDTQNLDTKPSGLQGFLLLLLRPSLPEIFDNPPDNSIIDADGIVTSLGMYNAKGANKYLLERVPILCVSENGSVGYTFPMRLDLHLCLHQLASSSDSAIDYPLGLFENRDVILVANDSYKVMLMYGDPDSARKASGDKHNEFDAIKLIYANTTTDEGDMTNLRRLEATAKTLLTPESETPPKLPSEVADDWLNGFLKPIFNHVKEKTDEAV